MEHPIRALPLLLATVLASAAGSAPAADAGSFAIPPLSVRQAGMGGVTAVGDDVLAGWTNPAFLGFQASRAVLAFNASSLSTDETGVGGAASWMIRPGGTLAGFASGLSGSGAGTRSSWTAGAALGFLSSEWLGAGLTVKRVSDRTAQRAAGATGVDAGLAAVFRGVRLGLAIRNAGAPLLNPSGSEVGRDRVPSETRIEAGYALASRRLSFGALFAKVDRQDAVFGGGAEWWPAAAFGVRAGASSGEGRPVVSAGLSAVFTPAGLDYSWERPAGGSVHRLALNWLIRGPAFGGSAGPGPAAPSSGAAGGPPPAGGKPVAPEVAQGMLKTAQDAFVAKQFEESRKWAEAVVRVDPANWRAWALLGNSLYSLRRRIEAISAYEEALRIDPGNAKLRDWVNRLKSQK